MTKTDRSNKNDDDSIKKNNIQKEKIKKSISNREQKTIIKVQQKTLEIVMELIELQGNIKFKNKNIEFDVQACLKDIEFANRDAEFVKLIPIESAVTSCPDKGNQETAPKISLKPDAEFVKLNLSPSTSCPDKGNQETAPKISLKPDAEFVKLKEDLKKQAKKLIEGPAKSYPNEGNQQTESKISLKPYPDESSLIRTIKPFLDTLFK
ncbi:uncharacterized protein LOC110186961 isoform X1 [Drosophila serrata]|uniref:uncharacterized protein LOC110186961 isoform X1 n=1 Tax=Drosophila serrata TaxID=7274 RepID=UPI000A1D2BFE|nr:uncharacterized protein LOC110186961 isoform X1 [Drosophila serrata]